MKRTILLLLSVIISIVVMADGITKEQAETIARQFVNQQQPAVQGRQMKMAAKRQLPVNVAYDANAYYVFNIGSNNGYVMVSGSDLTPQVLGYASEGCFNEENMPDNMKAWLDGYADQIAYIERTMGRNQAPTLRKTSAAIDPLLTSTWNQSAPYNNKCPTVSGHRTVTGCVATALAQVLNYYKYPAQTTTAIPAYTTQTYGINMAEIPVTNIDWANMLDDYSGSATTAQKNAVATLMKLCGQAVEMDYDYTNGGSTAYMAYDVKALRQYFGYDETVCHLDRTSFSASGWENMIYNELANGRPVLYGGQSTGGGHAFVVDGYDGNGLFHINWGWGGIGDSYFLLSVLNPYNNESIGSSSSEDGYSFNQEAVVGIQHGTGEKIADRFSVYGITNNGESSYTRSSSSYDFSGMSFSIEGYNMTGETHGFYLGLALFQSDGAPVKLLASRSGGEYDYLTGWSSLSFNNLSFGADLANGDYYVLPVSFSENSDAWEPCWGSNIYRIKATISGNALTLTEPSVNLSGTVASIGNADVNTTVNLQAQITNSGTDFNDYVYLVVDNTIVGGRIFEASAGETATFNIDFMPTTTGTKQLLLAYRNENGYVPFATGSVTITETDPPVLTGSITLTNANSEGNVEETTANVSAVFQNSGGNFNNGYIYVDLYKYNPSTNKWPYVTSKEKLTTITAGSSTTFTTSFTDLEYGGTYIMQLSYSLDGGYNYIYIDESPKLFEVIDPSVPRPNLTGTITLTNANSDGDIEGTTAKAQYTVQNTGTAAFENGGIWVDLYQADASGQYNYKDYRGGSLTLGVGASKTLTVSFSNLEVGGKYLFVLSYNLEGSNNYIDIANSELYFNVVEEKNVTLTADDKSRIYGDANPTLTYTKTGEGTLAGTPKLSCQATKKSAVGTYDIVISKGTVTNTNLTLVNGKLTVNKAPLTIKAGNYSMKQGEALPTFVATYEGFKNSETQAVLTEQPTFSCTATSASTPGEYPITVSGAAAQNYDISYVAGTLTITEADPVKITANNLTMEYGEDVPPLTFTTEGAALVGMPELTCEATSTSPVGTYAIVVKQGTVANYNVTYVAGTLTITKAPLNIAAGTYTKKQGEAMPEFTLTYTGFKNNETKDVLTKQPVVSCNATEASAPGEYPVTVSGAEAQNYDISYTNGKLIVIDADAIIVKAKSYSREYGEVNPVFEYTTEGATLDGVPEITCDATATSPVGTYDILVKQGTVTNYNVTYVAGTLTITKAPLNASVGNYSREQGQENPAFTISYSGWKNNENESVLLKKPVATTEATKDSPVGEYAIIISGGEAQNYEFEYVDGTLTVTVPLGIEALLASGQPFDVYTTTGVKVKSQVTTLKGLPRGIYIINKMKVFVR